MYASPCLHQPRNSMKHLVRALLLLLLTAQLLVSCRHEDDFLPLQDWQYQCHGQWCDATVPGCIHTDLMNSSIIQDPFLDTNEQRYAWVCDSIWTYRTTFSLTKRQLRHPRHRDLVFAGLDTRAVIFLNGHRVGEAYNMFRTWRFTIDAFLRKGDNTLEVRFYPVHPYNDSCEAAQPYRYPDHRVFTRTAPYQQGWDWGPRLTTCGIWQPCWIEGWTDRQPEGTARGRSLPGFFGTWGDNAETDDGSPHHPALSYQSVQLRRDSGAFCFIIDGKPVYMRGANWIPVHSFPVLDEVQKARYRTLLCAAKEANMNMIRVWGGGIYEPDFFYELCDSLGLYVWQDFNYSCAFYPGDSAFMENARIEAEEQVRRLSKHKCIVLWCGNNEVKNGWEDWGWQRQYGYTPEQCRKIAENIDDLFGPDGLLARVVKQYAPGKPYLPSSPVWGWGHNESLADGDAHYWGVWWGEQPFEMYRQKTGRFMSEYGFQGYPQLSTILGFLPQGQRSVAEKEKASAMLSLPAMRNHQKHVRGVAIVDQAMQRYFGSTSGEVSLSRYLYLSQLCQAYGTGMGIAAHRIRKGHCWGTLYWQLNDCWPVASWSSIDYFGNWKALHYAAKRLYQPLVVLSEPGQSPYSVNLYVVCDTVSPGRQLQGKLEVGIYDFAGTLLRSETTEVKVSHDAASEFVECFLPGGMDPCQVVLVATLYVDDCTPATSALHYFVRPRDLKLPSATVEAQWGKNGVVTLTSEAFAYGVALQLVPSIPGHFSDNYFALFPHEPYQVTFLPNHPSSYAKLKDTKIAISTYNALKQ